MATPSAKRSIAMRAPPEPVLIRAPIWQPPLALLLLSSADVAAAVPAPDAGSFAGAASPAARLTGTLASPPVGVSLVAAWASTLPAPVPVVGRTAELASALSTRPEEVA
jgi:hypothetical protein